MSKVSLIGASEIQAMIIELRGRKVMLDSDLAVLYQVSTKRLMEQVRRNFKRFPSDFMFQLSRDEWVFLKSQIATSGRISEQKKKTPYVFTRNGANMLSAVLRSPLAVQRSIQIMRAFSTMEDVLSRKRQVLTKSPDVLAELSTHSRAIMHLFQKDKIKTKEIGKVKKVIKEMIELLQGMVLKT